MGGASATEVAFELESATTLPVVTTLDAGWAAVAGALEAEDPGLVISVAGAGAAVRAATAMPSPVTVEP